MHALTSELAYGGRRASGFGLAPGLAVLTLILGAILLVRIVGLVFATTDLHDEEALHWYWSQEIAQGVSRPPIFTWLIGLVTTICGDSETCIRLPSPIFATASAFLIYALARHLYGSRVAFWATIVYATLPAVSAFAMVATPQAVFSLLWIAGLLALSYHLLRLTLSSGVLLGLVLGTGLLADHAMIYLPACTALFLAATPKARPAVRSPGTWLAIAVAVVIAAPVLMSNAQNGIVGFGRIAPLTDWSLDHLHPESTLLFVGLQFVLFGPILFFVLLQSLLFRRTVTPRAPADRFLLFHSVPILALLLFQVLFFSARAHWSVPAFPAAAIFVSALLLRHGFQRLLVVSIGIHAVVLAVIAALSIFAERFRELPAFDRLMGWQQFAEELSHAAALSDVSTIVMRGNGVVSEAIYYLRDQPIKILTFSPGEQRPSDIVSGRSTWAYGDPETVLLATNADPAAFGIPLGIADKIGEFPVQSYLSSDGVYSLYRVNPPAEIDLPR